MRTVFLLLMTMFVINATGANAQEMCSKSYVACIDKCVVKPSASLQETCIGSCQQQNTSCSAKLYGGENLSTAKTVTPEEMAKREEEDAARAQAAAKAKTAAKPAKPARQVAAPNRPADGRPR
jgi:hypothetical protein